MKWDLNYRLYAWGYNNNYQCGDDNCYDDSWGINWIDPAVYIYDSSSHYIAVSMSADHFRISHGGSAGDTYSCSQSLDSSGVTLVKGMNLKIVFIH